MARRRNRFVAIVAAFLALSATATADTFYYRLGGSGSPTTPSPPPPDNLGVFEIVVRGSTGAAVNGQSYSATTYPYNAVSGPIAYRISAGALPGGISIDSGTGYISGTSTADGTYSATVEAKDTSGAIATAQLNLDVVDPIAISGNPGTLIVAGSPYFTTFFAFGGSQPYSFAVQGNPNDLPLNPSATSASLSGSPAGAGTYPITVTVTESHGLTASYPYTLKVIPPLAISGTPPSPATIGQSYSYTFATTGGQGPFSYRVTASSLPSGVTLNASSGLIAGTPFLAQTRSNIQIKVTDSIGLTATTAPFTIVTEAAAPVPLAINGSPSSTASAGTAYATQFTAAGGSGSGYSFASTGSALPTGLTVNPGTGLLSGTPTVAGLFSGLQVTAADSLGAHASFGPFSIDVSVPAIPLAISGIPPNSATVGAAYAAQFTASGGSGSGYSFASTGSTLPPGLTLNPTTGAISGSPTTQGTTSGLVVTLTDGASNQVSSPSFSIAVAAPADPLVLSGTPAGNAAVGTAYNAQFSASGGTGSYSYDMTGSLPAGLSLNSSTGAISGSPTTPSTASGLVVTVTDGAGSHASSSPFQISVYPALAISGTAPSPTVLGQSYSAQFGASGGDGTFTFSAVEGDLPIGLSISPTSGLLSGTTTVAGIYNFKIQALSGDGQTAKTAAFPVSVTQSTLSIAGTPNANATLDTNYTAQFTSTGGSGGYTYVVSAGTLPPGLAIAAADGSVYGTPSTVGTYSGIVVQVTSGDGQTASSAPFSITVAIPALAITGTPNVSANLGEFYLSFFHGFGGDGHYTFLLTGTPPPGIAQSGAFLIGSPTSTGTYGGLAMQVTDGTGATATTPSFTITVTDPSPLSISGSPSTTTAALADYSAQWTAAGGNPGAYVFSIAGTLPDGLTFDTTTGILSGQATVTGTFGPFTVSVTDGLRTASASPFSLTITTGYAPLAIVLTSTTVNGVDGPIPVIQPAMTGQNWLLSYNITGGHPTLSGYTDELVGPVPSSFSTHVGDGNFRLNTPTPGMEGTYGPFRIHVTDQDGRETFSDYFSITITSQLQIVGTPPNPVAGVAYSAQVTATGGVPPYIWSTSTNPFSHPVSVPTTASGAHPEYVEWDRDNDIGFLTLDSSSGLISGTPAAKTSNQQQIVDYLMVTDSLGQTALAEPLWTITAPPSLTLTWSPSTSLQVGVPYSASVVTGDGTGPYVYSMICCHSLPDGLAIDTTTGTVSGTPTSGSIGNYTQIGVHVRDSTGATANTVEVILNVGPATQPALSISGTPATSATTAAAYFAAFQVACGSPGYVFSYTGTLPPGLVFNNVNGTISGTATTQGTYPGIQVSVHDSATPTPASVSAAAFSITVSTGIAINGSTPTTGTVGTPYSGQYTATGGDGNYTYSTIGSLPSGLTLNTATGAITGTPTNVGSWFGAHVRVRDGSGLTATSAVFGIVVLGPIIVSGTPQTSVDVDTPYAAQFAASGGNSLNYVWSIAGTLPTGITFNATTGTLSGTPTVVGSYGPLTVSVTDGTISGSATPFTLVVNATATPVVVTLVDTYIGGTGPLANGTSARIGQTWQQEFAVSGGDPGRFGYDISTVGAIPDAWSTGTNSAFFTFYNPSLGMEGSYGPFQIKAVDAQGQIGYSAPFFITINARLQIVSQPLNPFSPIAFFYYVGASGGRPPYHWYSSDGAGVPVSGYGILESYLVWTYDGANPIPQVTITDGPDNFGAVLGGFESEKVAHPNISVRDADGTIATLSLTWNIGPFNSQASVEGILLPEATEGVPYLSDSYYIQSGLPPYSCTQYSGTMPAGMSVFYEGLKCTIVGTPAIGSAGVYPQLGLQVTTGDGIVTQMNPFAMTVHAQTTGPLGISGAFPASASLGLNYFGAPNSHGGSRPYSYTLVGGTLPPGLLFNPAGGEISGTPEQTGTFSGLQVQVTDNNGATAITPAFSITVDNGCTLGCTLQ